jgi:hypothetical protein
VTLGAGLDFNGGVLQNGSAAGSIEMAGGSSVQSGSGAISLFAPGNVAVESLTTGGRAVVQADFDGVNTGLADGAGAVTDADVAVDVTAATLAARAGSGISLDTQVASLEAASQSGALDLANAGALAIGGVDAGLTGVALASGGGDVTVTASSPLTVTEAVSNTGGGNITLAALGNTAADDLTLAANVSASGGNGDVTLYAGDTISAAGGVAVSAANAGDVSLLAGTDFTGGVAAPGNAGGAIALANGSTVTSGTGTLTLRAPADVAVSSLTTGGAAVITADSDGSGAGAITDADVAVDVAAATLAARAASGISLDTQVASLEAASQSGAIDLANSGALAIGGVDAGLTGVSLASGGGAVTVTASGPLTVNEAVSNTGGGNVTLAALGNAAADDLTLNANVSASGGNGDVSLYAGDAIAAAGGVAVSAASAGDVSLLAGTNFTGGVEAPGNAGGAIALANGSTVTSGTGTLTLRAPANVAVSSLTTGGAAVITADSDGSGVGAITDADVAVDVAAATLAARAGSGISLDTQVATVAATTISGGVALENTGDLAIGTVDGLSGIEADSGDVLVTATGDLTVAQPVLASDGDIELLSPGDIALNAAVTSLDAGGSTTGVRIDAGATLVANAVVSADEDVELEAETLLTLNDDVSAGGQVLLDVLSGDAEAGTRLIEFGPDAITVSGNAGVLLNTKAPLASTPTVATLAKPQGDLSLVSTGGDVATTQYQKLTVGGTLTVVAGDDLELGDVTADAFSANVGDSFTLFGRGPGQLLLASGSLESDNDVDLVLNSAPSFNVNPTVVAGTGALYTPDGSAGLPGFLSGRIFQTGGSFGPSDIVGPQDQTLDLTGDLSTPQTNQVPPLPEEVTMSSSMLTQLNQVGARSKPLWESELVAFIECSTFVEEEKGEEAAAKRAEQEIPEECLEFVEEQVAAGGADPRFELEPLKAAEEIYQELADDVDAVLESLQAAADDYRRASRGQVTGAGFRAFVEKSADHQAALTYLDRLASLNANLEQLSQSVGTQTGDLAAWFDVLIDDVTPVGMSPEELKDALGRGPQRVSLAASDLPRSLRR